MSSDGSFKDSVGNTYKPAGSEPATHGQQVSVNDGYGNYKPGYMNYGVAVPIKKD